MQGEIKAQNVTITQIRAPTPTPRRKQLPEARTKYPFHYSLEFLPVGTGKEGAFKRGGCRVCWG